MTRSYGNHRRRRAGSSRYRRSEIELESGGQQRTRARSASSSEIESRRQLYGARRLIPGGDPETGSARPRSRVDDVAVRVVRQVRDRGRRARARHVHRRIPVGDGREVERVEEVDAEDERLVATQRHRLVERGVQALHEASPDVVVPGFQANAADGRSLERGGVELTEGIRTADGAGFAGYVNSGRVVGRTG